MNKNTNSWVLVLEDSDGALYTITPEILRLGVVAESDHEDEIRQYLAKSNGPSDLSSAFSSFKVVGSFDRKLDKKIRRDYTPPQMKLVASEAHPNP